MPNKLQPVALLVAFALLLAVVFWARTRRHLRAASASHHYPVYYTPHGTLE